MENLTKEVSNLWLQLEVATQRSRTCFLAALHPVQSFTDVGSVEKCYHIRLSVICKVCIIFATGDKDTRIFVHCTAGCFVFCKFMISLLRPYAPAKHYKEGDKC